MFTFEKAEFFRTPIPEPLGSHFAKIYHKVAKSKNIFQKFKSESPEDLIPLK